MRLICYPTSGTAPKLVPAPLERTLRNRAVHLRNLGTNLEAQAVPAAVELTLATILVAFAGLMVATNLFNTVAHVPLDEVLYDFRKPGDTRTE